MRESLTQRTLKGAAWIGGASVARLALRVVSVAILARLLTPHEYGVVAGALIAMDFAAMIYTMGLAHDADPAEGAAARSRGDGLFLRPLHRGAHCSGNVVRRASDRGAPADPGTHADPEGPRLAGAVRSVQRSL